MNIQSAIDAFGMPSDSDEVDDILEYFKCKNRPKGNDSLILIFTPNEEVAFRFSALSTYKEDVPQGPRREGWYILRAVDVESSYKGELPFALSFAMTGSEIASLFGQPLEQRGGNQTFFQNGIVVVVRFSNQAHTKITSIGFFVKDSSHSTRLGI